eukprot:16450893-Heterocapsa_arctica.AAC.1
MERVILNGLPHVSLTCQSRMHPQISAFLRPIYPQLRDNALALSDGSRSADQKGVVFQGTYTFSGFSLN